MQVQSARVQVQSARVPVQVPSARVQVQSEPVPVQVRSALVLAAMRAAWPVVGAEAPPSASRVWAAAAWTALVSGPSQRTGSRSLSGATAGVPHPSGAEAGSSE